jgi:hypothetical protein
MSEIPYSYHTFLFPFIWNDGGNIKWDEFKKILSNRHWVETTRVDNKISIGTSKEWILDYAAYQYFTEAANAAIFNISPESNGRVISRYSYHHDGKKFTESDRYTIFKGNETFNLNINGIRLYTYDIGVAILCFELENHEHKSLDAVNKINEYGRRINMPFLPNIFNLPHDQITHPICADKIEIFIDGTVIGVENYLETIKKLAQVDGEENLIKALEEKISLNFIMEPIQTILDGDSDYDVTTQKSKEEANKKYFIRSCVDDRMFVCCLVRDDNISEKIKRYNFEKREYEYLEDCDISKDSQLLDDSISNELYKLFYIETSLTCQNVHMKRKILEESVYGRWVDYGTIHAVTHHSIFCVTSAYKGIIDVVINPFLSQYVQLAVLVLAQRATILALATEASTVAEGFKMGETIQLEDIKKIEKLQAKYVKAQNQLMLAEATVQEQGVEIYNLLKKQLYIKENKEELDGQLSNLHDLANINAEQLEREHEQKLNNNLALLAALGIPLALIQAGSVMLIDSSWINFGCSAFFTKRCLIISSCFLGIGLFLYFKCIGKKKK